MGVDPGTAFTLECGEQSILRRDSFSATHVPSPKSAGTPQTVNRRKLKKLQLEVADVAASDKCKFFLPYVLYRTERIAALHYKGTRGEKSVSQMKPRRARVSRRIQNGA
jgi:hypothetical protein